MKKLLTILIILFFSSAAWPQQLSFIHDGLLRSYKLYLPSGYDQQKTYPLVLNLHGYGSNGIQQEFYSRFNLVADREGILVAYPEGIDNAWNVYSTTGVDDVGFLSALIDTISANHLVDQDRIYSMGMSMGGYMSHRLACELGSRVASIASVTGLLAFFPCTPSRPIPVLQIHGTEDQTVPYSGVEATINHWVAANGCYVVPEVTNLPDIDTTDGCTVTLSVYGSCDNQSEVRLYTVNGGEHTWPGAVFIIGVTSQDINASEEIWAFFRRYTLSGSSMINQHGRAATSVNLYPNPFSKGTVLEIEPWTGGVYDLRVTDISGKGVYEANHISSSRIYLDRGSLPAGLYLATVHYQGIFVRCKLMIR